MTEEMMSLEEFDADPQKLAEAADAVGLVVVNPTDELDATAVPHADVRALAKSAVDNVRNAFWDTSSVLSEVYHEGFFRDWGHDSFNSYVEDELDFQSRTARYLVSIFDMAKELPANVQDWLRQIGWSKAKELVGILTADNAAEWMKALDGLTVKGLQKLLKDSDGDVTVALGIRNGEVEVRALESGTEATDTEEATDAPEKARAYTFKLFPAQAENVKKAIETAKDAAETEREGHALDLIATEFLAANGEIANVAAYLKRVEEFTGLRLIGVDPDRKSIEYGEANLDSIIEPS